MYIERRRTPPRFSLLRPEQGAWASCLGVSSARLFILPSKEVIGLCILSSMHTSIAQRARRHIPDPCWNRHCIWQGHGLPCPYCNDSYSRHSSTPDLADRRVGSRILVPTAVHSLTALMRPHHRGISHRCRRSPSNRNQCMWFLVAMIKVRHRTGGFCRCMLPLSEVVC